MKGLLYDAPWLTASSPIVIHAHGGPAITMPALRSNAADSTRYPLRHLLLAGYKVFEPLFRGTLGFGNDFAIANFQRQGNPETGDLGDILQVSVQQGGMWRSNCLQQDGMWRRNCYSMLT
eukprot:m.287202 g.287202  ORF g.287202 m.287202 type:complete len:120 (-) comp19946_c0_seq2:360-719(-)